MKKFNSNYKNLIILFISMITGLLIGLFFKNIANYIKPLGTLFINLLSTIIIPIIFTSIVSSIAKIDNSNIKKLFKYIFITFIIMSLICALYGTFIAKSINLVNTKINIQNIVTPQNEKISILEKIVSFLSVEDFYKLLSKDNIIPLLIISIILGICINKNKNRKKIIEVFDNINQIIMDILDVIMKYAPIGICVFFASQISQMGISITKGYIKVFIIYLISSVIFATIVYSFIAKIAKVKLKTFWSEIMPIILTSISTCSSAACIPISIKASNNLKIKSEISSSVITMGTSFHKQGSIIDSAFKIMFLSYLYNKNLSFITVFLVAILVTFLISALPIGGGTISEMLILNLLGFPLQGLIILTIIATITDAPATMLNALGNFTNALLINKFYNKKK